MQKEEPVRGPHVCLRDLYYVESADEIPIYHIRSTNSHLDRGITTTADIPSCNMWQWGVRCCNFIILGMKRLRNKLPKSSTGSAILHLGKWIYTYTIEISTPLITNIKMVIKQKQLLDWNYCLLCMFLNKESFRLIFFYFCNV